MIASLRRIAARAHGDALAACASNGGNFTGGRAAPCCGRHGWLCHRWCGVEDHLGANRQARLDAAAPRRVAGGMLLIALLVDRQVLLPQLPGASPMLASPCG
jgi:hypothetical protein